MNPGIWYNGNVKKFKYIIFISGYHLRKGFPLI